MKQDGDKVPQDSSIRVVLRYFLRGAHWEKKQDQAGAVHIGGGASSRLSTETCLIVAFLLKAIELRGIFFTTVL